MGKKMDLTYQDQSLDLYMAEPAGPVKGGVLLIHEVWALSDHIISVADRLAGAGYLVLAPNLLSETDIAEKSVDLRVDLFNPAKRNEAQPKLRALMAPLQEPGFAEKTISKLEVCFNTLYDNPKIQHKVAVAGFCFGGSYSYSLAIAEPRLKAAAPFYGHVTTEVDELKNIKCPIMAFYGQNDEGLMSSLPEVKRAMQAAGVNYSSKVYPDCGHAFFNDSNPFAYNQAAATDAWQRLLKFLETNFA